jgi:Fe2+ transport system protein B
LGSKDKNKCSSGFSTAVYIKKEVIYVTYFTVPYNIDSEDKIIGGYLSLRQFAWIVLAVFIILLLFILNTGYMSRTTVGGDVSFNFLSFAVRIIIAIPFSIFCMIMAFIRKAGISADKFLFKCVMYKLRNHVIKNQP